MFLVFSSRLKKLRTSRKLSQKMLGNILGLSDKTISAYENGRNTPDLETVAKISNLFGVSVDYLIGASGSASSKDGIHKYSLKDVPIYNVKSFTQKKAIEYTKLPSWSECVFGLIMPDESCEPVILKGDVAFARKGPALEGDLVLWRNKKFMIRRIYFQEDSVILVPENSKFKPLIVDDVEIASSLMGVIVGKWQKF